MKKGWKHRDDIINTAHKALASKGTPFAAVGLGQFHWDLGFSCINPIGSTAWSSYEAIGDYAPLTLTMRVRCRRCLPCRQSRAAHWAARATLESGRAVRTWFCTMTASPVEQYRLVCKADRRLASRGVIYDVLSPDEQFSEVAREFFGEAVKMWKRLRSKRNTFIYLMVIERHKSGLPHMHALVHEVDPERPLKHADLVREWPLGFCKFKLAKTDGTASYVTKYLFKEMQGVRVRSSLRYGSEDRTNIRPKAIVSKKREVMDRVSSPNGGYTFEEAPF